jgi:hypothetical protein
MRKEKSPVVVVVGGGVWARRGTTVGWFSVQLVRPGKGREGKGREGLAFHQASEAIAEAELAKHL